MNIKNREDLLWELQSQLKHFSDNKISNLEVVLYKGKKKICAMSFDYALNVLVNNLYFNEEFDWSKADNLKIQVI